MNRVKIVATIGPRTDNPESLIAMRQAGMDIARLNGSHADLDWHQRTIELLHHTVPDVPVLLDIPGRKVRINGLKRDLPVAEGSSVVLTGNQLRRDNGNVVVDDPKFHTNVSPGDYVLIDDGSISLVVAGVDGENVMCHAQHSGIIRNGKGVHVPGARLLMELLSKKDRELIVLAAEQKVDFLGASFVSTSSDVRSIREALGRGGTEIVSKIETAQAVENLGEILEVSDALMIDRGDLSLDTDIEGVALLQKRILAQANESACPVIVATELLQSMIDNPVPTKAEIGDITSSVLDRASALMLSAETAVGQFPVESISVMRRVADKASAYLQDSLDVDNHKGTQRVPQAIGDAIALICRNLDVTKIVAITISGFAARMVSAKMPRQPILAVTNDSNAARRFNLLPGTKGIFVDIPFSRTSMEHIPSCLELLWRRGELIDEDLILVTAVGYPRSGNRMNLIQTHRVGDLHESLGWRW